MPLLETPLEIRQLWIADVARVTDPQLIALVLGRGSRLSPVRAARVRAAAVRAAKVGGAEVGAGEVGAGEVGAGEVGGGEVGARQVCGRQVLDRQRPAPRTSWTAVELAEELFAKGGWRLPEMARRLLARELDFAAFGIGSSVGGLLIATFELADRWCRGSAPDGEGVRCTHRWELADQIFRREPKATDAELLRTAGDGPPRNRERFRRAIYFHLGA